MPTNLPKLPKDAPRPWLESGKAREYLGGITPKTFYDLINAGHLRAYKVGRLIKVRPADADAYPDQHRLQPGGLRHLYPDSRTP